MPFLEECEQYFSSQNIYDVLGVTKDATDDDIKKAYRKMSLKVHPDRASEEDKAAATAKFQVLGKVYNILSDKDRRAVYDESGFIDDEIDDKIINWQQFWKSRFGGKDMQTLIDEFTDNYWGSETETDDLKKAYEKCKGDMGKILEDMYCRPLEDEERYNKKIQQWIDSEEVPSYRAFTHEKSAKRLARRKKYRREKKEAEIAQKNAKTFQDEVGDSMASLAMRIAQRNEDRMKQQDAFLDGLAAKYVKQKKTRKASTKGDAPGSSKKKRKT